MAPFTKHQFDTQFYVGVWKKSPRSCAHFLIKLEEIWISRKIVVFLHKIFKFMKRRTKWIIRFVASAIVSFFIAYIIAIGFVADTSPEFSKFFWIIYVIIVPIFALIAAYDEYYKKTVTNKRNRYYSGSSYDSKSSKDKLDIEDYRSMSEDRRHRVSGSGNWTSREDWDCGDYDSDGMSGFDSYDDNDF